jgi:hypothetical protein
MYDKQHFEFPLHFLKFQALSIYILSSKGEVLFQKNSINSNDVINSNIANLTTNRVSFASCTGPTLSLLGTSKSNPIVVQSPNFPQNYPINIWSVIRFCLLFLRDTIMYYFNLRYLDIIYYQVFFC